MLIRKDESKDYEIIYSVVKAAFNSAEHADGNEHDLVNALRKYSFSISAAVCFA